MNNIEIYRQIYKVFEKHNMDNGIIIDCFINTVVMGQINILAYMYVIIDRYVLIKNVNSNIKTLFKQWLLKQYYDENIVNKTKKYIQDALKDYTNNININFDDFNDESDVKLFKKYKIFLEKSFFAQGPGPQHSKSKKIQKQVISNKTDENGVCMECKTVPCVCKEQKAGFKEVQNVGFMAQREIASYKHLINEFNIGPEDAKLINNFWITFEGQESFKNKQLFYLYIIHLLTNVKLSKIYNYSTVKDLSLLKLFKDDKINQSVLDKFDSFFMKQENVGFKKYISKHEYNKYLKFKFDKLFFKKYLDIKKFSSKNDLISNVMKNIKEKIAVPTKWPNNNVPRLDISDFLDSSFIKNYIESEVSKTGSTKFYLSDNYYNTLQQRIEKFVCDNKINNKVILIQTIYAIIHKEKKNHINEHITTYYFE